MKKTIKSQIENSVRRFAEEIKKQKDFITLDEVTYTLGGMEYQIGSYEYIPKSGFRTTTYQDRLAVKEILKHGKYLTYSSFMLTDQFDWNKHTILHGTKNLIIYLKFKIT
jgi:hypothetical protein